MRFFSSVLVLLLFGCSTAEEAPFDGGAPDSGVVVDAGFQDSGIVPDAGPHPKTAEIEAFVLPYINEGWFPAISIALIDGDHTTFLNYGQLSATDTRPPNEDTIYEIGSVTKTFTALLLAQMAEGAEVSYNMPVQDILPLNEVTVPTRDNEEITLEHLATHFSGLPRMPTNIISADPHNPLVDYTEVELYQFLTNHVLQRTPGTEFEYSNLGAGLLGHALSLRAQGSYESVLVSRIIEPLGLPDTRITLSADQVARFAAGHDADGAPVQPSDLAVLAPAGELRSTTRDLESMVRSYMEPTVLMLPITMVTTPTKDISADARVGLAWFLFDNDQLVFHNGGTGGYSSFVAFVPSERRAVIAITNAYNIVLDGIGFSILRAISGEAYAAPEPRPVVPVDEPTLVELTGTYRFNALHSIEITIDSGRLYLTFDTGETVGLYPESPSYFYARVIGADVEFFRSPSGDVTHLVFTRDGQSNQANKL